jgi:hypothetical protein
MAGIMLAAADVEQATRMLDRQQSTLSRLPS